MKPISGRATADADIENAIDFYLMEPDHVVDPFLAALQEALEHIESHPETGSPRYTHELNIPSLRIWPITL